METWDGRLQLELFQMSLQQCVLRGCTLARVEWKKWAVITTHKLVEEEFCSGVCCQYIFCCDINTFGFNRESEYII